MYLEILQFQYFLLNLLIINMFILLSNEGVGVLNNVQIVMDIACAWRINLIILVVC